MTFATVQVLELKVPPLLVTIIFAVLMWLIARQLPGVLIEPSIRLVTVVILVGAGVFFAVAGVVSFRIRGTSVNPLKPDETNSLVTTGIYRVSRNPMYLGFMFLLLAWGFYLSNLYSIFFSAGFDLNISRFQIRSEEAFLRSRFGRDYIHYQSQVRRWL